MLQSQGHSRNPFTTISIGARIEKVIRVQKSFKNIRGQKYLPLRKKGIIGCLTAWVFCSPMSGVVSLRLNFDSFGFYRKFYGCIIV